MSRASIQVLSDQVANKIAAGEVVERPASVVKELLENALDAGATRVEVEVVQGGRKAILISDNGSGMDRDNALLSLERHATSKIRDTEDIEAIATLGFRGEALAAIASVSRFRLITRPHDALGGTRIDVVGGKVQDVVEEGCPAGTRMEVRNLFFNTPARRKFLRTEQTELTHIRQMILTYAVGHPEIAFRLVADGREWYLFSPCERHEDRIADVYGEATVEDLLPVSGQSVGAAVRGWIAHPRRYRKDRKEQQVFINGRPASAPVVGYALSEVFSGRLPKGAYPVAFLFLDMDPGMVDVNVHPMKKEVRFRAGNVVRDLLIDALTRGLQPPAGPPPVTEEESSTVTQPLAPPPAPATPPLADRYPAVPVPVPPRPQPQQQQWEATAPSPVHSGAARSSPNAEGVAGSALWEWVKVLGVPGDRYAVLETNEGVVLLDPRAAHERVVYERLLAQFANHAVEVQPLLTPEVVKLSPGDAERVGEARDQLAAAGVEVAPFGKDSVMVEALPVALSGADPAQVLLGLLSAFPPNAARAREQVWSEALAGGAARLAVQHQQKLEGAALDRLLQDLSRTDMPYTSPRGRPTMMLLGYRELDRRFGRS